MTWAKARLDELKGRGASLPPIVETLRMGALDDWAEGWVRKRWSPTPELRTTDGTIFGGYIAALADQALAFATMTVAPAESAFRTLNLQVNFIRVTMLQPLCIEARVVAQTRQLVTARAEFRRDDGELIAEASAQQLIMPLAPPREVAPPQGELRRSR
jgi:uncharacterized protein (TIGR00369 family)